jgi:glycine/D-amino acid oxidase-like deaminating enzyme
LRYQGQRFVIETARGSIESGKVVLAAGHGTPALAAAVGVEAPIYAQKGQILVTERLRRFLPIPGSGLRQTEDGTILIGLSKENTGFDDRTTVAIGGRMASRALRIVPELARVRLQRTWGGIRVLTPDNNPIYAQSEQCPGAFVTLCHSGVTLAAVHATDLAHAIRAGTLPETLSDFHPRRLNVQKAA